MDLRDYLRTLRKRWLLVVLCTVLSVGAAAGATFAMTPVYEARAQLFVSAVDSGRDAAEAYQGGLFTQQRVKSYADIVSSPSVTRPVLDDLGLAMTPDALAQKISTEVPLDTVLINVRVQDESPTRARDLANAVGQQFSTVVRDLETPQGSKKAPVKVSVVEPADAPTTPVSPRPKVNLALGLLVGLAVGVGAAVLRETLDTSVKNSDQLHQLTGRSSLGVIGFDPEAEHKPLIIHVNPRSPRAEAFRSLRTNLQFVDVDNPPRTVVMTSAVAGEGKSTSSCNLAIALAKAGLRVALVEADLRRPKIADYLGLEGSVGLTSVLIGQAELDDVLQPWGADGLTVLASGAVPPNPSELLGSQHMVSLLMTLQERADIVVLDAPPLLPVTDAAVLARICDGAVLVVRHGKTHQEQVRRAADALASVDARLLGSVLNMVPTKGADADHYGYAYGYGYHTRADLPGLDGADDTTVTPGVRPSRGRRARREDAVR